MGWLEACNKSHSGRRNDCSGRVGDQHRHPWRGPDRRRGRKAKALLDQEGRDDLALRIAVQPGGCAGLRYNLFFDDRTLDGDLTTEFGGVNLTVDRMSAPYIQGATIDFVDTIEKQGFTIDNPNATGSCACGDSFN